jgi:hypothetical protein
VLAMNMLGSIRIAMLYTMRGSFRSTLQQL